MTKTVAIAQARMGSTRFPGKVLRDLNGKPVLKWVYDAISTAHGIDEVVIATSTLPADDVIVEYCKDNKIPVFRGPEDDVLERFYLCALAHGADVVLRLTCDCPFLDRGVISEVVALRSTTGAHYASNVDPPSYPDGLDVECFTFAALTDARNHAVSKLERDCLTQYILRHREVYNVVNATCPIPGLAKERWVLDTADDYKFCLAIAERVQSPASYTDILSVLAKEPHLRDINGMWSRNERFYEGVAIEPQEPKFFDRSSILQHRATRTIPFGAQTFSKSHLQYPVGRAPLFATHGDGGYIFDVDGNRYVDLVSGLLPVILGYRDPDVDEAIRRQLDRGISLSLSTTLETELAELLYRLIPCAEMVKFGKSGTDVTSGAIRLARAYTGRSKIAISGYHGWADWSMAATDRHAGIPDIVRSLTIRIPYGDVDKTKEVCCAHKLAAIIVEPNDNPEYLRWLRQYCTTQGIILIFDEVITGFRYDIGGAQKLFDVTPDLACFGKAMGNGMPISAIVGRRDLMKGMQPPNNIFYSGTFFGEALSLAAAIACIKKMERLRVSTYLWEKGHEIKRHIMEQIGEYGLGAWMKASGNPVLPRIEFIDSRTPDDALSLPSPDEIRTLFIMEMIQQGVLIINSNNLNYAHQKPEIDRIKQAYIQTFKRMQDAIETGRVQELVSGRINAPAPLRFQ